MRPRLVDDLDRIGRIGRYQSGTARCSERHRVLSSSWRASSRPRLEAKPRGGSDVADGDGSIATDEPLWEGGWGRRNHDAAAYKPTEGMGSGSTYYPTSEELGKDEMRDAGFVGSYRSTAAKPGGRLHHGRARQRQALLLRLRPGLPAEHPRNAGAVAVGDRHLPHPPPRRPLRRAALPLCLRPLGGPLEAAGGPRPVEQDARGRDRPWSRE